MHDMRVGFTRCVHAQRALVGLGSKLTCCAGLTCSKGLNTIGDQESETWLLLVLVAVMRYVSSNRLVPTWSPQKIENLIY